MFVVSAGDNYVVWRWQDDMSLCNAVVVSPGDMLYDWQVTCQLTLTGWCFTCTLQCICCVSRWHVIWHWQDDVSPVLCSAVQLLCWQVTCHMTRTGWCVTSTPLVWWPCCVHLSRRSERRCWSSRSLLHPASPQQVQIFSSLCISLFPLFFFPHII